MIYCDHNATTPPDSKGLAVMGEYFTNFWANPSSLYYESQRVRRGMEEARLGLSNYLGVSAQELVFTSGGTESLATALRSGVHALTRWHGKKPRLLVGATEHSAVIENAHALSEEGRVDLCMLPVDALGCLDLEVLKSALSRGEPTMLAVMLANHETGVITPYQEAYQMAKNAGAVILCDAVQGLGKLPQHDMVGVCQLVDYLAFSAHKIHGVKGSGALFVNSRSPFYPLLHGGGQEKGRRSGTENVPGIIMFGEAIRSLSEEKIAGVKEVRDWFEKKLLEMEGVEITSSEVPRLNNTSHFRVSGVQATDLLIRLSEKHQILASAGSACHSGSSQPSHVLRAMGWDDDRARQAVRFSFGRETTPEDIQVVTEVLSKEIPRLRGIRPKGPLRFS